MDILTKICVVVLVVVVLAASATFVRLANVVPSWKYKFQQERTRSEMNAQNAANAAIANTRTGQQLSGVTERLGTQIFKLQDEKEKLRQELDAQNIANIAMGNKLTKIESDIRDMKETDKMRVERNLALASQVTALGLSIDKANAMNTRLDQELRKKTNEYDSLVLIGRARLERMSALEDENRDLRKQLDDVQAGRPAVAATAGEPEPETEITGTITAVMPAENVASINVGRAQGVRKGMKLVIYRGDKLVGWLRIEDVELQQAAGNIVSKQLDPMQGDKVATSRPHVE